MLTDLPLIAWSVGERNICEEANEKMMDFNFAEIMEEIVEERHSKELDELREIDLILGFEEIQDEDFIDWMHEDPTDNGTIRFVN